jgi:hypothetical protein
MFISQGYNERGGGDYRTKYKLLFICLLKEMRKKKECEVANPYIKSSVNTSSVPRLYFD